MCMGRWSGSGGCGAVPRLTSPGLPGFQAPGALPSVALQRGLKRESKGLSLQFMASFAFK